MATSRIWNFDSASLASALHFLQRHLFVGFVIEVKRLAPARLVAHDSFEDQSRAILAALERVHNLLRIDRCRESWKRSGGLREGALGLLH